jgi:hypothetical protein
MRRWRKYRSHLGIDGTPMLQLHTSRRSSERHYRDRQWAFRCLFAVHHFRIRRNTDHAGRGFATFRDTLPQDRCFHALLADGFRRRVDRSDSTSGPGPDPVLAGVVRIDPVSALTAGRAAPVE